MVIWRIRTRNLAVFYVLGTATMDKMKTSPKKLIVPYNFKNFLSKKWKMNKITCIGLTPSRNFRDLSQLPRGLSSKVPKATWLNSCREKRNLKSRSMLWIATLIAIMKFTQQNWNNLRTCRRRWISNSGRS